jgi:hypothetical protein
MVQSGFEVSAISVLFAHPGEICAGRLETLQSCATTSAINKMQNKRRYYGFCTATARREGPLVCNMYFRAATLPLGQIREGYCWRIYFKVLEVLFLGEVFPAFLPSKKACGAREFRC